VGIRDCGGGGGLSCRGIRRVISDAVCPTVREREREAYLKSQLRVYTQPVVVLGPIIILSPSVGEMTPPLHDLQQRSVRRFSNPILRRRRRIRAAAATRLA